MARWRGYGSRGSGSRWGGSGYWQPYVSVSQRRSQAAKLAKDLAKKGRKLAPVSIEGRQIVRTFWGKSWCENLEAYSDFANRLPRGRTYVRNGSVIDLQVSAGSVEALVSGSSIYEVRVQVTPLPRPRWTAIRSACAGRIDSLVELLQGKLSDAVLKLITCRENGLFPSPREIEMSCSCPDIAGLCKHLAAVLYGVGARLDDEPGLFFRLRSVDEAEMISDAAKAGLLTAAAAGQDSGLAADDLSQVFGIEIDRTLEPAPPRARAARRSARAAASPAAEAAQPPARERGRRTRPAAAAEETSPSPRARGVKSRRKKKARRV